MSCLEKGAGALYQARTVTKKPCRLQFNRLQLQITDTVTDDSYRLPLQITVTDYSYNYKTYLHKNA